MKPERNNDSSLTPIYSPCHLATQRTLTEQPPRIVRWNVYLEAMLVFSGTGYTIVIMMFELIIECTGKAAVSGGE